MRRISVLGPQPSAAASKARDRAFSWIPKVGVSPTRNNNSRVLCLRLRKTTSPGVSRGPTGRAPATPEARSPARAAQFHGRT